MHGHDGLADGEPIHPITFVDDDPRKLVTEQGRGRHKVVPSSVGLQVSSAGQGRFNPDDHVVRSCEGRIYVVAGFDTSGLNKHTCAHFYDSVMGTTGVWTGNSLPIRRCKCYPGFTNAYYTSKAA